MIQQVGCQTVLENANVCVGIEITSLSEDHTFGTIYAVAEGTNGIFGDVFGGYMNRRQGDARLGRQVGFGLLILIITLKGREIFRKY